MGKEEMAKARLLLLLLHFFFHFYFLFSPQGYPSGSKSEQNFSF